MPWNGHERRRNRWISDETFNALVERAAEVAAERVKQGMYAEIGKVVVRRALLALGLVLSAALLLWAKVKLGIQLIGMKE